MCFSSICLSSTVITGICHHTFLQLPLNYFLLSFCGPIRLTSNNIWNTARTCSYKLLLVLTIRIFRRPCTMAHAKILKVSESPPSRLSWLRWWHPTLPQIPECHPSEKPVFPLQLGPQPLTNCVCFLSLWLGHMIFINLVCVFICPMLKAVPNAQKLHGWILTPLSLVCPALCNH